MNVMSWDLERSEKASTLSLKDVQAELFSIKDELDRSPVLSENKYTERTLVGNWLERRARYTPEPNNWRTSYDADYRPHINKTWKENKNFQWDNKLNLEGLPKEILLNHTEEYYNNMATTYDLTYNVLPKQSKGPNIRTYNTRKLKWVPEQDLAKSYGSVTQFGLREILKKDIHGNSEEGIAKCRWYSTYTEEIADVIPLRYERCTQFNRRIVNLNEPDLEQLERKSRDRTYCLFPHKDVKYNMHTGLNRKNKT